MKNLMTLTDEQLVNLYLSDVDEAFDMLLNRYKDKLYSYILFAVKNSDIADDLFQETFIKAITQIRNGRYVDCGKFYPWLTRIAHNLIIDVFRSERNENTISADDSATDLFEEASLSEASIENTIICEQSLADIRKLVDFLPENQRQIVEMRYYQDLSFKEIAQQTGISINTALGRMRYAIINMRKMATESHLSLYAN